MLETEIIGNATLYRGDALVIIDRVKDIDAVITDPPYSSGGMTKGDRSRPTREKYQSTQAKKAHPVFSGDNKDQRAFAFWSHIWGSQCLNVSRPGSIIAVFSDWRQLPVMTDVIQSAGWVWRGIVPWDKTNSRPMPNRFRAQCEYIIWGTNSKRSADMSTATYHPGIVTELPPVGNNRYHSTQKPTSIMQTLSKVCPENGVILDPFMGSGTTGIAALSEGRKFIGIEKSAEYFDIACERIRKAQKP